MSKYLVVAGHGAGDPGAVGNGLTEAGYYRDKMIPAIKKYAKQLKKNSIEIYDTSHDMFKDTKSGNGAYKLNGFESVTELHLDAAGAGSTAHGGHVIIHKGFNPDASDKAIANVVKKYIGWFKPNGFDKRDNLLNLNVCAKRGVGYRLIEFGFITSLVDTNILKAKVDTIAKELVEAITGESLAAKSKAEYYTGIKAGAKVEARKTFGIYSDVARKKKVRDYPAGGSFKIKGMVKNANGTPLFITSKGNYCTANKEYIKVV
ncbi:N-acetylmuramoyl-L-alanine amidase [Periweissella cryptocerci]|uniref:N-acetylmuramoyl-L-alanine amidase n=1 Tax=Periweissella cryptocerci TaxID=2506420 RepID=A0A4P6YWY3_9LACO|nr:N-acetylmuramoyl-L-alanine amidase [Periweissella cryptocerci]QBO37297.1 N-acetylmuramoyl-L-alanine amidase [Periweissella cryptocerci]